MKGILRLYGRLQDRLCHLILIRKKLGMFAWQLTVVIRRHCLSTEGPFRTNGDNRLGLSQHIEAFVLASILPPLHLFLDDVKRGNGILKTAMGNLMSEEHCRT